MLFLNSPVNLLARIALEPCQAGDMDAGGKALERDAEPIMNTKILVDRARTPENTD